MGKKVWSIMVLALTASLIAGCGSSSGTTSNGGGTGGASEYAPPETLTFVMSHAYPASDFRAQGFAYFAEEVEKRTDGSVKIDVHPAQALVKLQDAYDAVTSGTVDIQALPTAYITNKVKDLSILDVSGSFPADEFFKVEEAIHPIISDILQEHNVQYILPSYEAGTAITLRKGEPVVKTPDLSGYKVRDYGKYVAEGLKAWKATPVNIPLSDLNLAVQNQTVDGVYFGWPLVKAFKIYEQTPTITYTGLSNTWLPIGMNMDSYNKLSDEQKKIFEDVKWEAMAKMEELAGPEFEQLKQDVEAAGGVFYTLTADEQKLFLDALQPIFEQVEAEAGPNGKRLIEALNSIQ